MPVAIVELPDVIGKTLAKQAEILRKEGDRGADYCTAVSVLLSVVPNDSAIWQDLRDIGRSLLCLFHARAIETCSAKEAEDHLAQIAGRIGWALAPSSEVLRTDAPVVSIDAGLHGMLQTNAAHLARA